MALISGSSTQSSSAVLTGKSELGYLIAILAWSTVMTFFVLLVFVTNLMENIDFIQHKKKTAKRILVN